MTAPRTTLARAGALTLAAAAVTLSSLTTTGTSHAAAPAPAAKVTATIKLASGGGNLNGVLKSPKATCRKNKTVSLMWKDVGAATFIEVAQDATTTKGAWKVPAPGSRIPAGKYYVKVPAGKGCKSARSTTLSVS